MQKIKAVVTDASLFRRSYVICLFLCNVTPLMVLAYAALPAVFLWGVFLLIYREVKYRSALRVRLGLWLILFVIASTVTAIVRFSPNSLYDAHNLVMILHSAICFFIYYGVHTEEDLTFRRELYSVCLACLMANIRFEILGIKFIVHENRFAGLFSNPNQLGFYAVVAIICSHMLLKKDFIAISGRERVSTIWIASCAVINAISLLLSDSNGALVLMLGYVIVFLVYKMLGSERKFSKRQILTKSISALLAGAVIVAALFFVRNVTQKGFSEVMKDNDTIVVAAGDIAIPKEEGIITFEHENKNIDSGRIKLWKQAWEMYKQNPVMGIGKGNVFDYGNRLFEHGVKFSERYGDLAPLLTDFHNGYLTILVCTGAVGFLLFLIFGVRFYLKMFRHVFRREGLKESTFPCMFAFLCSYAGYAVIEEALLYNIMFTVVFFWLIMGYASCFVASFEPDGEKGSFKLFGKSFSRSLL